MGDTANALAKAVAEATSRRLGRTPADVEAVAAGLGDRRFFRLRFDEGPVTQMMLRIEADSPLLVDAAPPAAPPKEPVPPAWLPEPGLEPLRTRLENEGLPVPASHGHDARLGLDWLEDLGSRTLLDEIGEARARRYLEACALLPRLQAVRPDRGDLPAFRRRYDRRLVATKARKWLQWTIPALLGRPATDTETRETHALFEHVATLAENAPAVLSHRDFKAENLHLAPPAEAGAEGRLVMIDVQGAFLAPPEYDLVCLLYDLQTTLPESLITLCCERTRVALASAPDAETFAERFDALAIARLCKDVSHVVHAARQRGDARRFHEVPRGLELIRRAAGRRAHTFPGLRALHSVIGALTAALDPSDSG